MSPILSDFAQATTPVQAREPQSPARLALDIAVLMLALLVPTLLAMETDERLIFGITPWLKPLHFELSIAIHFATLSLLIGLMAAAAKNSRLMRWTMQAAAFAALFEIGYIVLQAARGQTSHFNNATPLAAVLYGLMGVGAIALVTVSFITGWLIWRQARPGIGAGLKLGSALGLMLGSVATLIVAGALSSGNSHWIGGVANDAPNLPFFGWSTTDGDLRVPHFFATHGLQFLPIVGWLADHAFPDKSRHLVLVGTGGWLILVVGSFVQALAGMPFFSLAR